MTIFHKDCDKNAQTKLKNYIYETYPETELTGIESVELLNILLQEKDYTAFESQAYDMILNGIPFDRADSIPEGIEYEYGIVPSTMLKFLRYLRQANKQINSSTFSNFISDTLLSLKSQMTVNSGDFFYDPLSTGVLLYTSDGSLTSSFRAGTYISDINPLIWLQEGYDASGMVYFYEKSQKSSEGDFSIENMFMPYYVRAIPENSSYGENDTFVFNGFINGQNQATVQYEALSNLAEYCYYGKKFKAELDKDAYFVLLNSLNSISKMNQIPTDFDSLPITADNANITMDNTLITADQTEVISAIYTGSNLKGLAYLGNAFLLAYKIKNIDAFYLKAKEIFNSITLLQNEESGEIGSSLEDNLIIYKFMNEFNNFYKKDAYDIINSALDMMNLRNISEDNENEHPQNFALVEFKKAVNVVFRNQIFEFERASYTMPCPANSVDLLANGIDPHRIQSVEYTNENGNLSRLELGVYQNFIEMTARNNPPQRPQRFYLYGNSLFIDPYPDKDYGIEIIYFKEPEATNMFEIVDFPIEFYPVIKYYIAHKIALAISSPILNFFLKISNKFLGIVYASHRNELTVDAKIPSNINFSKNTVMEGYNTWAEF